MDDSTSEWQQAAQSRPQAAAASLIQSSGIPQDWILAVDFDGHPLQLTTVTELGELASRSGQGMVVFSTGEAAVSRARPGGLADTNLSQVPSDKASLTLSFDPPPWARQLSLNYRFLSAEFGLADRDQLDRFEIWIDDALGSRSVATATAANADMRPVSLDNAAGSGFDLFGDPDRPREPYDTGLPLAGLSSWNRLDQPLAPAGPITVRFVMHDAGDGLLDSAVLLDGLRLTGLALEAVGSAVPGTQNAADPLECLGRGGIVQGAVADGVTRIYFRFFGLPGPGDVIYSIAGGNAPEDGGYDDLGGDQRLDTITIRTEPGAQGWQSIAQYLVPEDFNRGGDTGVGMRIVNLRVDYFPDNPDFPPSSGLIPFQIWRPPVVLMHGLWSSGGTWKNLPLRSDGRFITRTGDYSGTAASWFSVNRAQPFTPINDACVHLWDNLGVAMSQVDYVGHSMGGILGREANAISPGLINKFVTMNTPHTGSPLGNAVVSFRGWLNNRPAWFRDWVLQRLDSMGHPIDKGALDDLSKGSSGIAAIPATNVPSHALVGIGGSDLVGDALAQVPGKLGVVFKIMNMLDDHTDLFADIQHDFVVGRRSQEGGISPSAISIFDGLHSTHFFTTGSSIYSSRIVDLFNAQVAGSDFAHFPAPIFLDGLPDQNLRPFGGGDPELLPDAISIVGLMPGQAFEPGDEISFTLEAESGFDIERAVVFSQIDGLQLDQGKLSGVLEIPLDYLGPLSLTAMARDGEGRIALAADIPISVTTDLALEGIEILQRFPILRDWRDRRRLTVLGTFSDGVVRDISDPSTGTTYQSANSNIVAVLEDGMLVPRGEGITTVIVQSGGFQDSITVEVLDATHLFTDRFQ